MASPVEKDPQIIIGCEETFKHLDTAKETLLKPIPKPGEDGPCSPKSPTGKARFFSAEAEAKILSGDPPMSGEIPAAIALEQVQLNNYHFKLAEKGDIEILLCGALDAADAYTAVNNCFSISLLSESSDLAKYLEELSKNTAEAAKKFPEIADKIKKAYEQICAVQTAFNTMKQCIDKVCNADEKKKLVEELKQLDSLENAVKVLVKQGEEAVMSVIQAASIYALNNVTDLQGAVAATKPLAEQFKKDTDANIEANTKKVVEWQKKYNEALVATATAYGEHGKASTQKHGKEVAFCFMSQSKAEMKGHKQALLDIFNATKVAASQQQKTVKPELKKQG